LDCIRMVQKVLGWYDEIHEKCVHVLETNPHDDGSFFEGEEAIDESI
jgi:hypothetical protein